MLLSAYNSATSHGAVGDEGLQVVTRLDLLFGSQQVGTAMAKYSWTVGPWCGYHQRKQRMLNLLQREGLTGA